MFISIRKVCSRFEQLAAQKLPELLQEADRMGVKMTPPHRFHLKIEDGRTRAVEETTQAFVDFGSELTIEKLV